MSLVNRLIIIVRQPVKQARGLSNEYSSIVIKAYGDYLVSTPHPGANALSQQRYQNE